jgi:hypothetical protein
MKIRKLVLMVALGFIFMLPPCVFGQGTMSKNLPNLSGSMTTSYSVVCDSGATSGLCTIVSLLGFVTPTSLGLVIGTNVQAPETSAASYGIANGSVIDSWGGKAVPGGTPVGTTDIQTMTNKSLTSPIITGGSATLAQIDAHTVVSSGSVAMINTTPTSGGTGYAANDTGTITTGLGDATYKVLTVGGSGGTVVQTVGLVFSGSSGYSVATGQATTKGGSQPGSGSGLTINVTAIGLAQTQVSNTQVNQYNQGAGAVTNYLPSAQAGEAFITTCGTVQSSQAWSLAGNSGIQNGSSGDILYLNGVAGTAGSSHGIQIVSPTVGAEIVCKTAQTGATTWSWFCVSSVGAWIAF